eukprot:tig00022075_g23659.t1
MRREGAADKYVKLNEPDSSRARFLGRGGGSQRESSGSARATTRFDYVIVFENINAAEHQGKRREQAEARIKERRIVTQMVREAKLVVSKSKSRDGKEIFLRLGVPDDVLASRAEFLKLLKRVRTSEGIKYEPFVLAEASRFEGYPSKLFTSNDRIRVIQFISRPHVGGCQIPFESLARRQVIKRHYPLHDDEERGEIIQKVRAWNWLSGMPPETLWGIRDYFGESVAMYFAFLGFYNRWLIRVALLGIVVAVVQFVDRWPAAPVRDPATGIEELRELRSYDGPLTPFWCIFVPLAATWLVISWNRTQGERSLEWGTWNLQSREVPRPEFRKDEERAGFYTPTMDWVDLAAPERSRVFAQIKQRFPAHVWTNRFASRLGWGVRLVNYAAIAASVLACVCATLVLLVLRSYLHARHGPLVAAVAGGLSFVLAIETMSTLYMGLASRLTDHENHRFKSAYERSFVNKMFIFEFVNNYIAYFYIAFVKFFQVSILGYEQRCLSVEEGAPPNCMYELSRQLGSIMLFQILLGNVFEVLVPFVRANATTLYRRARAALLRSSASASGGDLLASSRRRSLVLSSAAAAGGVLRPSKTEAEGSLQEPSLFDEYREMARAAVRVRRPLRGGLPLAAFLAWLNNVIEIRTDAMKLLGVQQRPRVTAARDIGSWLTMLRLLTNVSIITNVLLICFVSTTIDEFFSSLGTRYSRFWKLFLIVTVEHTIFALKFFLEQVVQPVPRRLREETALQEILVEWEKRGEGGQKAPRLGSASSSLSLSSLSTAVSLLNSVSPSEPSSSGASAAEGLGGYDSPRTDEEPPHEGGPNKGLLPLHLSASASAGAPAPRRSLFVRRGTTGIFAP